MSDYVVSWIRTVVPTVVGLALAQLAQLGIEVDSAVVEAALSAVLVGAWYALARKLEQISWLSWINGVSLQPRY